MVLKLCFLVAILSCGCHTVHLSPEKRITIKSVSISPEVKGEDRIDYMGPALEGYEPFNPGFIHFPVLRELMIVYSITPIGLWTISRAYGRMEDALTERMQKAGVDVGEIVRGSFQARLKKSKLFPEIVSAGADATLHLWVKCGISNAGGGMSAGSRPWLRVEGSLLDSEGEVLWRRRTKVSTFQERVPAYEIERFYVDPELFRDAVARASSIAVGDLLLHMSGG